MTGPFTAGSRINAATLNRAVGKLVARAPDRTTVTGTTGLTVLAVLRLDDAEILANRTYTIEVTSVPKSTIAGDGIGLHVRHTTDGSTPTTASPVLPGCYWYPRAIAGDAGTTVTFRGRHFPAANQTLSLLLCIVRADGTGSVSLYADANSPTTLMIYDDGPTVATNGAVV